MKLTKIYGIEGDDYHNHRVITALFNGDVLFSKRGNYLMVISAEAPNSDVVEFHPNAFIEHIGDVNLNTITDGSATNFTVRCNPVKRNIKTRKLQPVFGAENITAWFTKRIAGIELTGELHITENKSISVKNGTTLTHHEAIINGSLIVNDIELFESSILKGIGQAKFLGFGLLNIFDNI